MAVQLTDLEQLLLLAALRVGEESYAAALREDLGSTAERAVSLGTIYVTMMRLEEKGLVTSRLGDPTPERGGKAKRLYEVTAEGREALEAARSVFDRMWSGVPGAGAAAEEA